MTIELETERLILKTLDSSYSKEVLKYYSANKDFFETKMPSYETGYFTEEYQSEILEKSGKDTEPGNSVKFFIFLKNDKNRIIGDISVSNIVKGAFLSCHLGYKLDEKENGKGYALEALKKIIDYSFNELGLHRIEANIMPANTRSIKLAARLGFFNEGLSKNYLRINGKWEDHLHYVLLNKKFRMTILVFLSYFGILSRYNNYTNIIIN